MAMEYYVSVYSDMERESTGPMMDDVHGDEVVYLPGTGGALEFNARIDADPPPEGDGRGGRRKPPYDVEIEFSKDKLGVVVEHKDRVRLSGALVRRHESTVTFTVVSVLGDRGQGCWRLGLKG